MSRLPVPSRRPRATPPRPAPARGVPAVGLLLMLVLLGSTVGCRSVRHSILQMTSSNKVILEDVVRQGCVVQQQTLEQLGEATEALGEVARTTGAEARAAARRLRSAADASSSSMSDSRELLQLVEDAAADLFAQWGTERMQSTDEAERRALVVRMDVLREQYELMLAKMSGNVARMDPLVGAVDDLGKKLRASFDAESLAAARGREPILAGAVADLGADVDALADQAETFLATLAELTAPPEPVVAGGTQQAAPAGSSASTGKASGPGADEAS